VIDIRPMTAADLPLGIRLGQQVGWNQTPSDWQRFLDLQPDGCFVGHSEGLAVSTITTFIFGSVAWIAMVLVEASHRGRGIATALLEHALSFLDGRGIHTVRLDATPLGQPLYARLGFVEQLRLARYEGVMALVHESAGVETALADHWEDLAVLDHLITNTDRRQFLARLFAEQPQNVRCVRNNDGRVAGFMTARPGAKALMFGPCVGTPEAAALLLADAARIHAGQQVYIDVPLANRRAVEWAETQGLTVQRHLTRMCRGVAICEQIDCLWASSGPEKG
jgi:GNAT superfamily N-acetyltransferase